MSQSSIYEHSEQVTLFINQTPDTPRTLKNIARHLGLARKNAKAAIYLAIARGDLSVVLCSPLNSRKKRPVFGISAKSKKSEPEWVVV